MEKSIPNSTILVVGAGIAGISVAAALAETGARSLIIEKEPWIGGRVSRVARYFPKFCPPSCGMEIHGRRLYENPRIEVMVNTVIKSADKKGDVWQITLETAPSYVSDACTGCGQCIAVCPKFAPNPFNLGMNKIKAIDFVHPNVRPHIPFLMRANCVANCNRCEQQCPVGAISLNATRTEKTVFVKTIVAATGWSPYDIKNLPLYGAGTLENVIPNVVMERLYSPDGPTGGKILKTNGDPPKKVAFVQCAGSRDANHLPFCSEVCCAASIKQASYVKSQNPNAEVTIYYIDRRTTGRNESMLADAIANDTCRFVKGKVGKIEKRGEMLSLRVEDTEESTVMEAEADMVVLALGMTPTHSAVSLPLPFPMDDNGFLENAPDIGLIAAGTSKAPFDVASTVRDAAGAAVEALICEGVL
ncbi:MAG: CoB--CoM heterodisulfide reductase iron-sulfur subunit A family protein [Deltaproteobacteria bacterium]|nr:CoB--CoM heterodisulfide reductase iron-sulfur subunit A family protein [Deltaproteobacteria bacterium]